MYIGIYFFQRFNIFINRFFIFIFDCVFQLVQNQIRSAEFYTSLKDFTETGVVIKNRITLFDGGINFADYFFIIGVAFGFSKCCELGFLTTNDITGGNSGSPVINGNGELIGAAFDGNWESLSGDINFDNNLQRCIAVDIRYVLFIIDKLGGCKHLIDEMTIVE